MRKMSLSYLERYWIPEYGSYFGERVGALPISYSFFCLGMKSSDRNMLDMTLVVDEYFTFGLQASHS